MQAKLLFKTFAILTCLSFAAVNAQEGLGFEKFPNDAFGGLSVRAKIWNEIHNLLDAREDAKKLRGDEIVYEHFFNFEVSEIVTILRLTKLSDENGKPYADTYADVLDCRFSYTRSGQSKIFDALSKINTSNAKIMDRVADYYLKKAEEDLKNPK